MGQLDQFAKRKFAEETPAATRGAIAFQVGPELGLSDVRLDGLLVVKDPLLVDALIPPWSLAATHGEVVLEIKMPGDHVDLQAKERALLRRQARQVKRVEHPDEPFRGQVPLWFVAPILPGWIREVRQIRSVAQGCYRIEPASFDFLWIAANELPLADELIPFLVARSGRPLQEFARWVARRKPSTWVVDLLDSLPMGITFEEVMDYLQNTPARDPQSRRLFIKKYFGFIAPDVIEEIRNDGHDAGLAPLVHLFERRLARRLSDDEHAILRKRLKAVGPERLGDVVLDLSPQELAVWLADPNAK
ncbi:MAG: hypothetical protein IPM54_34675 [Polyangiaceae bacterium]|nr:hypothetical protein [Polyangiaceae bacterium]